MQADNIQETLMANDSLSGKREHEEEYFRKQDQELVEKMRRAAATAEARRALGAQTGIQDPDLLDDVIRLGFSAETVGLLPLVPILQVAWAEGGVSSAERALIVDLARTRGIVEGSPADAQLSDWLAHRPAPDVFSRAARLVAAIVAAGSSAAPDFSAADLVSQCEKIAAASGGFLGLGKVSPAERTAIEQIQHALESRRRDPDTL